jgi:hypothetical protein
MGNYQICGFCGHLFERNDKRMCNSCDEMYQRIRRIVVTSPDTMVLNISLQTGVSVSRIMSFVENGYFRLKEDSIEVSKK